MANKKNKAKKNISNNRIIPKSDIKIYNFLNFITSKIKNPGAEGNILSVKTTEAVHGIGADFIKNIAKTRVSLSNKKDGFNAVKKARKINRARLRGFHKMLETLIGLSLLDKAVRVSYWLDDATMPELGTDERIRIIMGNFIFGETARLKAGGKAMPEFPLAEMIKNRDEFMKIVLAFSALKESHSKLLQTIKQSKPPINNLVRKIHNEIETKYDNGDADDKRFFSKIWGLTYVIRVKK
jgi:hypothetical protein